MSLNNILPAFVLISPVVTESNTRASLRFLQDTFSGGYIGCRKQKMPEKHGGEKNDIWRKAEKRKT